MGGFHADQDLKPSPTIVLVSDMLPQNECWELTDLMALAKLCCRRECALSFGVCAVPGGFVVTGGWDEIADLHIATCAMFTLTTNSWTKLQPLRTPRSSHGAVFKDGKIMVFGGCLSSDFEASSSVESLEITSRGKWLEEPAVPVGVAMLEVVSTDRGIFLLDTKYTSQFFHLDTGTRTWSARASAPPGCEGARMVHVEDQLLVAGGFYKRCLIYNLNTDTWATGASQPSSLYYYAPMFSRGRMVYLIGKNGGRNVEEYNLHTETWSMTDLRLPISGTYVHALVVDP